MKKSIGEKITPILLEIEKTLFQFESISNAQPNYSNEGFRAATKIFMSAVLDKMWNLQENEKIDFQDRINMATKLGNEIKTLIKTYTDIDIFKLY